MSTIFESRRNDAGDGPFPGRLGKNAELSSAGRRRILVWLPIGLFGRRSGGGPRPGCGFQVKNEPAPDFALQDAEGNPVRLQDLRGKAVVLHFVYAGCPDVCPLHAERIAQIQETVNATPMKEQVGFVTITTDPKRDTPDLLRGYGEAHGLDRANWSFLTSGPDRPEDTTRKLAESFGHRFSVASEGYQIHSVVTHIIDRNGQWVGNFHGLKFDPTSLVVFVNALGNDIAAHGEDQERTVWETIRSLFQEKSAASIN